MAKTVLTVLAAMALMGMTACGKPADVAAAGPPCVSVDAATFAANPYKPKPSTKHTYLDATFAYALGNSECHQLSGGALGFDKYAVCDFSNPMALQVDLENGEHAYYTSGLGQSLRVTIKDGATSCAIVPRS